ncbi:CotH kinase family protein [Xanthocytophaga agilis]|uniref:CotH kinase family protein n=1 Tax=Xanthocytophaga agilis TaxID=3048010 RepID=A0AAE3R472_9BACT|nr:CotH kinase family protein [Xanthocytophaga agilis]MDJ1500362.1 CotH kinase family protein [Xanthocytophaga agilis]
MKFCTTIVYSFLFAFIPFVIYSQNFTTSNLPIIIIDTHGQTIVDDPKIIADMGMIDNGPGTINKITDNWNNYTGKIGIEIRGSSSQMYPKKSYGFETRDPSDTEESHDVSLLGLPAENDWILYAPYSDKSMLRDVIAYHLSQRMGWYASRFRYCELVVDGEYKGVYILLEKIKRNSNRVNISKLKSTDNSGDNVTGGYILKIDKTTGTIGGGFDSQYQPNLPSGTNQGQKITFLYEYPERNDPPKGDDITPEQEQYIQGFMHAFESSLKGSNFADSAQGGYRKYINTASFIDYFLLTEAVFNVDGYRISTFMHKNKDSKGGLLTMGPVWDYNISQGNADYYNGNKTDQWAYRMNYSFSTDNSLVPFWWERLLEDTRYRDEAKCRWITLRKGAFYTDSLMHFIDSLATILQEAQNRNYQRWPILKEYVWPNAVIPGSYQGEVDYLKTWLTTRLAWLDYAIPGVCDALATENENKSSQVYLYPNPSSGDVYIQFDHLTENTPITAEVYNMLGQKIATQSFKWTNTPKLLPASQLSPGILLIKLYIRDTLISTKKVIRSN